MAVQSTYLDSMAAAFAGMIADTGPNDLFSREVETVAGVGFGVPVQQGTSDDQIAVMGAGATNCVGITVRDQSTTNDKFAQKESALLMRNGPLWVVVTQAAGVSADDDVWVTLSTGTFGNADPGGSNGLKLAGCRWETSGANGELAKIRVNLDVPAIAGAA